MNRHKDLEVTGILESTNGPLCCNWCGAELLPDNNRPGWWRCSRYPDSGLHRHRDIAVAFPFAPIWTDDVDMSEIRNVIGLCWFDDKGRICLGAGEWSRRKIE